MPQTGTLLLPFARSAAAVLWAWCLVYVIHCPPSAAAAEGPDVDEFTFNGFHGANLTLDGLSWVTPDGLLELNNATNRHLGQAFYPNPIRFRTSSGRNGGTGVRSFSTTFIFLIQSSSISGHGILLIFTPKIDFRYATGSQYMGVFNTSNYRGSPDWRILAVELDTVQQPEFEDMNDNHVGIDVNAIISKVNHSAGYYAPDGEFRSLNLSSGEPIQVWVDYDSLAGRMTVTLAHFFKPKPRTPLLSLSIDLSQHILDEYMYVGFSSSTGPFPTSHYISGWSFSTFGEAKLDLSALPSIRPGLQSTKSNATRIMVISLPTAIVAILVAGGAYLAVMRKRKYAELMEDWELQYGVHRFRYKVLYDATDGFSGDRLLGSGGFGSVYKGVLPATKVHVAVKKVSHESRQGMREFVAEIVSIGRIRHRNIVQLLGYCRRKGELLLVYEFMAGGSLDQCLFRSDNRNGGSPPPLLDWNRRFQIIKGAASGLHYLHEQWEQVVIHRDIKASNVLIDDQLDVRLGDFGLARLYDHGTDLHTTHVMGTMGYVAPELIKTSKATKATDVFAFGIFLLEVTTGRRPVEPQLAEAEVILVDCVWEAWKRGELLEVADARLGGQFDMKEVEMVLMLGLLCSHPLAAARPMIKHVVGFLNSDGPLPEMTSCFSIYHPSQVPYTDSFTDGTASDLPALVTQ